MLFNTYTFIFGYLPIVWAGFFLIGQRSREAAAWWLGLASVFFYGWWDYHYVPLLLGSVVANFWFGKFVVPQDLLTSDPRRSEKKRQIMFYIAVIFNLTLLGYFKYINFFIETIDKGFTLAHLAPIQFLNVVLPIGISFFTFTQMAYLVDCWEGKVKDQIFSHYLLFVSYFPHLVAGPLLHHGQMMPQFAKAETYRLNGRNLAVGLVIFAVGLAKKVIIADLMAAHSDAIFSLLSSGATPSLLVCWAGAISYTFQIYFDFSGYTDMAIGMSLFFNVALPVNFNSPYRATSIIDFWQRWHISLTRYLREYVYFPLGGNRLGRCRQAFNVMITMLLSGLWHGASWTFIAWGALHGLYILVNHLWNIYLGDREERRSSSERERELRMDENRSPSGLLSNFLGWALTFTCVCFAFVLFRSDSFSSAAHMMQGMLGLHGLWKNDLNLLEVTFNVSLAAALAFFGRNLNRLPSEGLPQNQFAWGYWGAFLLGLSLLTMDKSGPANFIYFKF